MNLSITLGSPLLPLPREKEPPPTRLRYQFLISVITDVVEPILRFHTSEIIEYVLFYVWLLMFHMLCLRFIHVVYMFLTTAD